MASANALKGQLSRIKAGEVVLIVSDGLDYPEVMSELLEYISRQRWGGVYVTVNKPYTAVARKLERHHVDLSHIYFIDTVSPMKKDALADGRCIMLESASNLSALSIAINQMVSSLAGDRFLFIDSFSTLSLYNSTGNVSKFAHFLTARMRMWSLTGIFIALRKDTDDELLNSLSQFCDRVIDLSSRKPKKGKAA